MYLAPEANFRLNKLLSEVVVSQNMADIKPRVFYQDLPYYSLYFRDISRQNDWQDVFLYSQRSPDEDTLLLAKRAGSVQSQTKKEGNVVLFNGVIHSFKKKEPENYSLTLFTQKTEKLTNMFTIKQTRRSTQLILPIGPEDEGKPRRHLPGLSNCTTSSPCRSPAWPLDLLGLSLGISTEKGGEEQWIDHFAGNHLHLLRDDHRLRET